MTIRELYEDVKNQMVEMDKGIEYMKGKREALNSVRLDLFSMIEEMDKVKEYKGNE